MSKDYNDKVRTFVEWVDNLLLQFNGVGLSEQATIGPENWAMRGLIVYLGKSASPFEIMRNLTGAYALQAKVERGEMIPIAFSNDANKLTRLLNMIDNLTPEMRQRHDLLDSEYVKLLRQ